MQSDSFLSGLKRSGLETASAGQRTAFRLAARSVDPVGKQDILLIGRRDIQGQTQLMFFGNIFLPAGRNDQFERKVVTDVNQTAAVERIIGCDRVFGNDQVYFGSGFRAEQTLEPGALVQRMASKSFLPLPLLFP